MRKCPELNQLEFSFPTPNSLATATPLPRTHFNNETPVPVNLRRLQCRNAVLTLELIEWLGKLPNLSRLFLNRLSMGVEGLPAASTPNRFLSLKTLRMDFTMVEVATALHITLTAHNLTTLAIALIVSDISSSQVSQFFASVAESCPKLAHLGLVTLNGDTNTHLGWLNALKPLPIRFLYLINYRSNVWTLANASRVIGSWAEFSGLRVGKSTHLVEDLGDILPFHPNLTALEVELRGDTWTNFSTRPVLLKDALRSVRATQMID
ncbi:hypothetical protein FRC07_008893 [Ceratobasidium sp. 392]|nr:hypothetical protein FRC07_008893 [Ceratobasidium sp. 392]